MTVLARDTAGIAWLAATNTDSPMTRAMVMPGAPAVPVHDSAVGTYTPAGVASPVTDAKAVFMPDTVDKNGSGVTRVSFTGAVNAGRDLVARYQVTCKPTLPGVGSPMVAVVDRGPVTMILKDGTYACSVATMVPGDQGAMVEGASVPAGTVTVGDPAKFTVPDMPAAAANVKIVDGKALFAWKKATTGAAVSKWRALCVPQQVTGSRSISGANNVTVNLPTPTASGAWLTASVPVPSSMTIGSTWSCGIAAGNTAGYSSYRQGAWLQMPVGPSVQDITVQRSNILWYRVTGALDSVTWTVPSGPVAPGWRLAGYKTFVRAAGSAARASLQPSPGHVKAHLIPFERKGHLYKWRFGSRPASTGSLPTRYATLSTTHFA